MATLERDFTLLQIKVKETSGAIYLSYFAGVLAFLVGIAVLYTLHYLGADFDRPASVMTAVLGIVSTGLGLFTIFVAVAGAIQLRWKRERLEHEQEERERWEHEQREQRERLEHEQEERERWIREWWEHEQREQRERERERERERWEREA